MIQSHFEGGRDAEEELPVVNCQDDTLPGFGRLVELAGADRKQRVEICIALCQMRVEHAEHESGCRQDSLIRHKAVAGLQDVPVGTVGQDLLIPEHDMGPFVAEE